ncbi:MAG TPA: GspE/PulE family protein, partial [Candidatus Paceibacterota bacterium]
ATDGSASDIHIEPWRENVRVRFRVDGVMNTSLTLPSKVHLAVVARIKILSNMRLDEKRKPQDGRFTASIENRKIDFRVSTFPTYFGEKVVMRILDQEKGVKKLDEFGLSKRNLEIIRRAITKPYGLVLISGPTGSGKTTTLYSMLNELDREHQNVLSLEDPIEYNIEGLSQSQVQADIGYTFASGLRTTLRQDPDVIMVGEIRDKETAQLAIQAALTGHLVLSTIHTNNAVGVIPRLIDMGIDPYLIAPTLILAMAQRLTLGLCPGAGVPTQVEGSLKLMIDKQFSDLPQKYIDELDFTDKVYKTGVTSDCPNGTRGRVAVMEVMEMDKDIESVILKNPTDLEIEKIARSKGMITMKEDAILKSMHQVIPFEEVNML